MQTIQINSQDSVVRDLDTKAVLTAKDQDVKVAKARKLMEASLNYLSGVPSLIAELNRKISTLDRRMLVLENTRK
jgi:hypothetical protein